MVNHSLKKTGSRHVGRYLSMGNYVPMKRHLRLGDRGAKLLYQVGHCVTGVVIDFDFWIEQLYVCPAKMLALFVEPKIVTVRVKNN